MLKTLQHFIYLCYVWLFYSWQDSYLYNITFFSFYRHTRRYRPLWRPVLTESFPTPIQSISHNVYPKLPKKNIFFSSFLLHFYNDQLACHPLANLYYSYSLFSKIYPQSLHFICNVDPKMPTPNKITPKLNKFTQALLVMVVIFSKSGHLLCATYHLCALCTFSWYESLNRFIDSAAGGLVIHRVIKTC